MSYTPKTEDQLAKEGLMHDGTYDCEVTQTNDKPSKAGNTMFTLKLNVFEEDGSGRVIYDYIALGNNFGERKLRHAADAFGLLDIYDTGNLKPSDFQDKAGKVQIKTQEGSADFPLPKNVVADYVKRPSLAPVPTGKTSAEEIDDSVPF